MKLLSIDPATTTAVTIFDTTKGNNNIQDMIVECKLIDLSKTKVIDDGHRLLLFRQHLSQIIREHQISHVCVESYFFSSRFCVGSNLNPAFRAIVWMVCAEFDIPYEIINITQWKTFIGGQCKPDKKLVRKLTRAVANKEYIKQALIDKYGIKLEGEVYDVIKGCKIPMTYDVSDSIAIGIYCLRGGKGGISLFEENQRKDTAKEKEKEALKIAKEKEKEALKIAKEKEKEALKVAKEKEKEALKIAKEKEKEALKIAKEKEKEALKIAKEKEKEEKKGIKV
jgi:Holliday junction resolvasome RuvABC endonuclease subunit